MANGKNLPPTTAFSKAFGSALREVMAARSVTQTKVADAIHRDQTFVSERTSGKRPCDTDIIAGVAMVAGVSPQTIVRETLARMRGAGGGSVTALPPRPPRRPSPRVQSEAARDEGE